MEKILINNIEQKFGKPNSEGKCTPFGAVVYDNNKKATAWDSSIIETIAKNEGKYIMAQIEISGKFVNIRGVQEITEQPETTEKPLNQQPAFAPKAPARKEASPQMVGMFVKKAVDMMIAAPVNGKNIEENLCENIQEIKKCYDFTCKLLENNG